MTSDYVPYSYLDQNGKMVGKEAEKVKAFLDKTGVDYEFKIRPFSRGYRDVQRSSNTLIFALNRTKERENGFHWIFKISDQENHLITRNEDDLNKLSKSEIISGKYKAMCKTSSWQCKALENYGFKEENIVTLSEMGMGDIPRLILRGRADFFISDEETLSYGTNIIGALPSDFTYSDFISKASGYLAGLKMLDPRYLEILLK